MRRLDVLVQKSNGYVTAALRAMAAAVGRWPVWVWCVGVIATAIVVASFLMVLQTATAKAQTEPEVPLDCLSCHQKVLKGHNRLGTGSEACWACHYNYKMGIFHLSSGAQIPRSDYPQLCAQCHQKRYGAWMEGTHGVAAWKEGETWVRGTEKVKCASCHNPHQPQITFPGITKPHPPPVSTPPPLPVRPLIVVSASLLLLIVVGVAAGRQGLRP